MNMSMKDCLASILTIIETNIETRNRLIMPPNFIALFLEHPVDSVHFRWVKFKVAGNMSLGNNKRVQFADGIFVAHSEAVIAFALDPMRFNAAKVAPPSVLAYGIRGNPVGP